MTRLFHLSLVALFAVGCGGSGQDADTTTPAPTAAAPASDPSASTQPAPTEDPGSAPIGCEAEIARQCEAGFTDGCLVQKDGKPLTLSHVCVPSSETGGPPCTQEIARQCPEGQKDACLIDPPVANTHVCVVW